MKWLSALVACFAISGTVFSTLSFAQATPPSPSAIANQIERSRNLLDRAAVHLAKEGDDALVAFTRVGEFHDGELYVYVLGLDGTFLASGGSSAALIGRNVRDYPDAEGKYFFREMLDHASKSASGRVEYRWFNPVRGRIEPKTAEFRTVGDRIVVVGSYRSASSIELAKSLLWRAVHHLKQNGEASFDHFNSLSGGFVTDDLYVFVIGLEDGIVRAHGGSPRQVGRNADDLVDADGRHFAREMIELAREKGEGDIRYAWRNPVSLKVEKKHSYIVRVGDYLVGVGAYEGPLR